MAHAQKPDFVFRRNGRVHLNRRGRQFSRLLAVEVCALEVVMLDTPCSEVVWRVLATHSIRQFPLHFSSSASQCAITFQPESAYFFWRLSRPQDHIAAWRIKSIKNFNETNRNRNHVLVAQYQLSHHVSLGLNGDRRWTFSVTCIWPTFWAMAWS